MRWLGTLINLRKQSVKISPHFELIQKGKSQPNSYRNRQELGVEIEKYPLVYNVVVELDLTESSTFRANN